MYFRTLLNRRRNVRIEPIFAPKPVKPAPVPIPPGKVEHTTNVKTSENLRKHPETSKSIRKRTTTGGLVRELEYVCLESDILRDIAKHAPLNANGRYHLTTKQIVKKFGNERFKLSIATVSRWRKRWEQEGKVSIELRGRCKTMKATAMTMEPYGNITMEDNAEYLKLIGMES